METFPEKTPTKAESALESFLKTLRKYKDEADQLAGTDWNQVRSTWKQQIANLYLQISTWLQPYQDEGLLEIAEFATLIEEPYLGPYETKYLMITTPKGQAFKVIPSAHRYLSTLGRVDLQPYRGAHAWNSFQFLQMAPDQWIIYDYAAVDENPLEEDPEEPLSEDSFIDCLHYLVREMEI